MRKVLRCKMRVMWITQDQDSDGNLTQESINLTAVYGEGETENAQWSKYTPAADFNLTISNPAAFGALSQGHEFYVDITPVVDPEAV